MKINTGLPADDLNAVGASAKTIEDIGFTGVSTQENRQDAFLPWRLQLRTQNHLSCALIAIAFSRAPWWRQTCLGICSAPVRGAYPGIGSQVKAIMRRFSVPWSAPAPRMREYVQSLRAILLGEWLPA